ncbi:hypothetical protein HZQ12_17745 [Elizabethkingia anophelis]|uniref:hypothetical protein n=1 Tax=Elizabethkingia anophelis TaxID=1117645 RepID=UPI0021A8B566|nr:hypothetical protein [Elizabethkingia anophelis]MCT3978744.1 hypothetical protein [Elizabethkingia anophelis]MCT4042800.1 hypothetical protein [Elizabethkingia anophelis]
MNLAELRVGNYIRYANVLCTIENINGKHVETNAVICPIESYNPIPLTNEWLFWFDFKVADYEKRFQYYFYEGDVKYKNSISVSIHDKFCRVNVINQEIRTIKYVHELQNLFYALTSEELKLQIPE